MSGGTLVVTPPLRANLPSPHIFGDAVFAHVLQASQPDRLSIFCRSPMRPAELRRLFPQIMDRSIDVVLDRSFLLNADFWVVSPTRPVYSLHPDLPVRKTLRTVRGSSLDDPARVLHIAVGFPWSDVELDLAALVDVLTDRSHADPSGVESEALALGYESVDQLVATARRLLRER
jgi:hypothetical protein